MWRRRIDLDGSDAERRSESPLGVEGLSRLGYRLGVVVGSHEGFEEFGGVSYRPPGRRR
jgi:hypothetical protein